MFKKLGTTAAALLVALTLTACGPTSGVVTSKHYEPERTYNVTVLVGKVPVIQSRTDYEDWVVTFYNAGEDKSGSREVPKEYYDTVEPGDFVNFDEK